MDIVIVLLKAVNFFVRFYLFIMRDTERSRDTGRGRNRLHAWSLMWDLIPGLQDYALGRREMPNC